MRMLSSAWISNELKGVSLPDKRYQKNLEDITKCIVSAPGNSFSSALGERLRKSAWRLFSQGELSLLSTHQHNTIERCSDQQTVLIVEDTTDIVYHQAKKEGLGPLGGPNKPVMGLNMHSAMALDTSGTPLGIVHQKIWAPKSGRRGIKRYLFPIEEKETIKWIDTLRSVNKSFNVGANQRIVLIGDREADFFEHYSSERNDGIYLLIRVQQKKRKVIYEEQLMSVSDVLTRLSSLGSGSVKVWRKPGDPQREVIVHYYATTVELPPTYRQRAAPQKMQLLWIKEEGAGKIEWVLLTHLPVCSLEQVKEAASYYAKRWTIERFHYVLKSGLRIEKLQSDTARRLSNALQIYSLAAWHLLLLQKLGHNAAGAPATDYIDTDTVEILGKVTEENIKTVSQFITAIGKLGGFRATKKQPLPGEQSIWKGIVRLKDILIGFLKAKQFYGTG